MIELVIKLHDGQPVDHPITRENFQQVWPDLDFDNPGPDFVKFLRIDRPIPGVYQVVENYGYCWNEGRVEDLWMIREMTTEEKTSKQNFVKENWSQGGFPSWTFNEETCTFDPPVPYPSDGGRYYWDEDRLIWAAVEIYQ